MTEINEPKNEQESREQTTVQDESQTQGMDEKSNPNDYRLFFGLIILGCVLFVIHLTFIRSWHVFDATASLYIGLPFILALALSLTHKSKSAMGASFKAVTILLLMSAPLLGEGFICILMAAPVIYMVVAISVWAIESFINRDKVKSSAVMALIMLASLEGVTPYTTFDRDHEVEVSKIVNASYQQVSEQMQQTPNFSEKSPWFIQIFPHPRSTTQTGTAIGDTLSVEFEYKKHIWWNAHIGQADFVISQQTDNLDVSERVYSLKDDTSYLSKYLTWDTSKVRWEKIDNTHTRITWTINYQRNLDPSWYFGPLEYYSVTQAAKSLIDNVATPKH